MRICEHLLLLFASEPVISLRLLGYLRHSGARTVAGDDHSYWLWESQLKVQHYDKMSQQ